MRSRNARRRTLRKPSIELLETRQVMSASPWSGLGGGELLQPGSLDSEPPALVHHGARDADFWIDPLSAPVESGLAGDVQQLGAGADALTGLTQVRNDYGLIGTGQTVAVIDSGVAWDHVALGGGFGASYRVVGGWDFAENDANPYDDGPSGSHGSLVTGVIGADRPGTTDDGVASGVDLVSLRVFDDAGNSYFSWIESALQWVHQNRNSYANPITTVNISLGTDWNSNTVPGWSTIEDELAQLKADGIFIAVAAGNGFTTYNTAGLSYPAASPSVVPVMSVDDDGSLTYYSQRHSRAIAAPGRSIVSTVPDYAGNNNGLADDYATYSGTSMAAPYLAGASVIIREAMQFVGMTNITQDTIYNHMAATADQFYDSATSQWYDRLNMQAALDALMPADDYGSTTGTAHNLGTVAGASLVSGTVGKLDDVDYFQFTASTTGTVTFTATTTNTLAPVWTGTGSASGANNQIYTIAVVASQTYTVGLSTSDGIGHYDLAINAGGTSSNIAPVLGAIGNKSVNEGSLLTFTATATDANAGQTKTFSLDAGAPTGASINATTGVFTWTPTESQGAGTYNVTIRVTDNGSPALNDFETIAITVNEVNVAPVLGAIGNKSVNEGSLLTFTATATDADSPANTKTFSLDAGAPTGASINATTGVFTWTPTESQGFGTYNVTVRVTDNGSPALNDFETIAITVNEVNVAPVLGAIGNKSVNEGSLLTFTATATDADSGQTKTFSLDAGAPTGASINATTGVFTWTPTESQGAGTYNVTVRVTDNGSPALNDFETIAITVNEVNSAPVLGAIGNKSVNEGSLLTFTATATDADSPANTKTFSLDAGAPTGASINATTGVFTWTPTESQGAGTYNVTVRVTDNGSPALNDFETIAITVNEVNDAPVLSAIGNKSVVEGSLLTFTATATDADSPANTKTFSLDAGAPTGASINATTGVFTWTPTLSQGPGVFNVTIRVTDNGSPALSDFETITITVFDSFAATDWGVISQSQVDNVAISGEKWYQVQASQDGYLTAKADFSGSAGNIDLAWYDNNLQLLAAGVSKPNSERVDQIVSAGQQLYLRVSGTNADVDFRLTNLVQKNSSVVKVKGTNQNDLITISGGNSQSIDVNGVDYTFDSSTVTAIEVDGKAGVDTLSVSGGNVASLRPTGFESATDLDSRSYSLNQDLGLRLSGNYYLNSAGFNEKWLLGNLSWYFITPDGSLYRATNVASLAANPLIAELGPSFYADPTLVHESQVTEVMQDQQFLTQVANSGLHFQGSYYLNWGGLNEKWMLGNSSQWYFITPDGTLYQWTGGSNIAGSTVVGNIGSTFYTDPMLLQDPFQVGSFSVMAASQLDQSLNLSYAGSYTLNWGGWNEKWMRGDGGLWYFITPSGGFYQWSGTAGVANSRLLATFDPSYYTTPSKLHNALVASSNSLGGSAQSVLPLGVGAAAAADGELHNHATDLDVASAALATTPTTTAQAKQELVSNRVSQTQVGQSQLLLRQRQRAAAGGNSVSEGARAQAMLELFADADGEDSGLFSDDPLAARRLARRFDLLLLDL